MRAHQTYDWANPATCATNRVGELTSEQRRLIGRPLNGGCLLIGAMMAFVCCVGLALAATRTGNPSGFLLVAFPVVIVAALVGVNRTRARAQRDADSGQLVQAQGQVVWRGARYVAEAQGRRLRPLRHYPLPAPGPYEFCYLARSGLLLSAAPIYELHGPGAANSRGDEPARLALVDALAQTLRFSPADLTANRAGRLSAAQRRRLVFDVFDTFIGTLGGVAGSLVLALGALALAAYSLGPRLFPGRQFQVREMSLSQALPVTGVCLALLLVVGGVAALLAARPVLRDAWTSRAASIEGEIVAETGVIRAATVFYYVVRASAGTAGSGERAPMRPMRFIVSPSAYRALIGGRPYRLYYLPQLHTLLSVEPLAAAVSVSAVS